MLSIFCEAQSLQFQTGLGTEVGWWIYNKGSHSEEIFNTEGWDRSHLSLSLPLTFSSHYKIKRFHLGVKIDYVFWFNKKMMASEDSDEQVVRYPMTKGSYVNFFNYMLSLRYELLQKKNYILLPYFNAGSFWENSLHPQKDNFGKKWCVEIGIENQFFKKNYSYWIRLKYLEKRIESKTPLFINEKHHYYTLGAEIGIGLFINKKETD